MHETQFPLLSHMARIVFAVPAASSKSERVFSVAGNTDSEEGLPGAKQGGALGHN